MHIAFSLENLHIAFFPPNDVCITKNHWSGKSGKVKYKYQKKQATIWFFYLNMLKTSVTWCGKSNIWVCFWLICKMNIKKDRPHIYGNVLYVFLSVLLIKKIAHCCFFLSIKWKWKIALCMAGFGRATGNILVFFCFFCFCFCFCFCGLILKFQGCTLCNED